MAGLENINDIVGQKVWDDGERLLKLLDNLSKKMLETSTVFKTNAISGSATKEDIAYINQLIAAQKEYQNVTRSSNKVESESAKIKREKLAAQRAVTDALRSAPVVITNETNAINQNTAATQAEIEAGRKLRAELDAQVLARRNAAQATRTQASTANRFNPVLNQNTSYRIVDPNAGLNSFNSSPNTQINPLPPAAATNINNATKGLKSFWSVLRNVAYIVPGIGIAGIFALAGAAIAEFFTSFQSGMSAAVKAQRDFNDAVTAGNAALAAEVQTLQDAQNKLYNNSKTREEINAIITSLSSKYPEYLGFLNVENESIEGINQAISNQINLLKFRNLETAAREAAKKSEQEYEDAVNNTVVALTTQASLWQKVRGVIVGQSGATVAYGDAVETLTLAFNKSVEARKKESDVINSQLTLLQKREFQLHDEIDNIRQLSNGQIGYNDQQLESIRLRKVQIESIGNLITYYGNLKIAADNANSAEDSQVNNDVKYWQARVDLAKKNSKDYISSSTTLINAERDKELTDLKNKYIVEKKIREDALKDNQTYQIEVYAINAKAIKAQRLLQEGLVKYNTKQLRKENRDDDDARKARIAAEKEYQDALRDNRNSSAEENIQTNKEIFENEKESLSNRMEAYSEYYTGKQNQARSNADKELADIVQLESEIKRIEAEDDAHRSKADKALLLRKEGIAERRKGIELKLAADEAKISEESARDILKIQESYSKQQIALLEIRLAEEEDINDRARLVQMRGLLNQAQQGLISWRDYEQQKGQISKDAQADQLKSENVELFNEIERTDLTQEAKEKLIKKYYDNLDKLRRINLAKDEADAELAIKREREKRDAMFSIAESGLNTISGLLDAEGQREKARSDAAKDEIDYRYDQEEKAIKANGDTKEQQEIALADLEASRATEKKDQDKEQAIRNRALAVQQKQITILGIILSTSLAVIKAYTEGDPYTKVIRSIAAGAAGAAQLAIAVAAPIPEIPAYKEGTGLNLHKGGAAIVGDGYVPEWIKEPGKKGYWSPAQPVKLDLARGTSVTTPDQLAAMATHEAIRKIAANGGSVTEGIYARQMISAFESLIGETKGVKKAIGNKPTHNTILTEKGLKSSQRRGNSWTSYINNSVRN